jgi:hypothetical protein
MRSNRIALLAVLAGSGLLGSAVAGVSGVSGDLARAEAPPASPGGQHHHPDGLLGHRGL